jgi:hypothetical protein
MLVAIFLCWRAVLQRVPELEVDITKQQWKIKASLIIVPLASFALYMLLNYSLGMLLSNSLDTGGGIATPTPIHDPLP